MAKCLCPLIGPANRKKSKNKKEGKERSDHIRETGIDRPTFAWISEHQMAFDALKIAQTTAPVLQVS